MDEKRVEKPAASSGEVQALLSEATTLLKSLRPAGEGKAAIRAVKLSSPGGENYGSSTSGWGSDPLPEEGGVRGRMDEGTRGSS